MEGILVRALEDARLPAELHEEFLLATGFTDAEELAVAEKDDLLEILVELGLRKLKAKAVATAMLQKKKRSSARVVSGGGGGVSASLSGRDPWQKFSADGGGGSSAKLKRRESNSSIGSTRSTRSARSTSNVPQSKLQLFAARAQACTKIRAMKGMHVLSQEEARWSRAFWRRSCRRARALARVVFISSLALSFFSLQPLAR
jgi:hypothetical protein